MKKNSRKERRVHLIPYTKKEVAVFGIGLVMALIGSIFLAVGDTTLSPIFLVLGYVVIIPISLFMGRKKS